MTELLKAFEDELVREDKTPITIRNYTNDISLYERWLQETYGEGLDPAKTCERDIIEYRSFLGTVKAAAPKTINRRLASLTKFYEWCVARGMAQKNPAKGIKGMAITLPAPKALDTASLRKLLRAVHAHDNAKHIAIIELLCGSGCRVGELISVQKSQVKIGERSGSVMITNGKGRAAREIPLNLDVRKALAKWLEIRPDTSSPYLFVNQRGQKLTASGIWRIVKQYGELARISDLTIHALRHTVLTRLVREFGCDLVSVARISGHKNVQTLSVYTQPSQEAMEAMMEKLSFTG